MTVASYAFKSRESDSLKIVILSSGLALAASKDST